MTIASARLPEKGSPGKLLSVLRASASTTFKIVPDGNHDTAFD
jgi:hypothetical protein